MATNVIINYTFMNYIFVSIQALLLISIIVLFQDSIFFF